MEEGGSRRVKKSSIAKALKSEENSKVGVCGVVPYLAVKDITNIDFQFSAVNAAIDAHYRGISTILFVSHNMLPHVLKTLEERNVPYSLDTL